MNWRGWDIRRWGTRAALVVIAAAAVLHASRHVSTGPASGDRLHRPDTGLPEQARPVGASKVADPRASGDSIRLAAFNIQSGKGLDDRRDLTRTADFLRRLDPRPDLIGLNEVRGPQWFIDADQTHWLGETLGLRYLAAPTTRTWYHCTSGNGLLSRREIDFWQRLPLPRRHDRSQRNVVLIGLPLGDRTIRVLLTHLTRGDGRDRRAQLNMVGRLFLSLDEPVVLMGDLNSTRDDPLLAELLARPGVVDAVGRMLGESDPTGRIDWIITRGLQPLDAGVVETRVSDHPLVWAELRPLSPKVLALREERPTRAGAHAKP